ncbi:MAG: hypothetical protein ABIC04_05375 [Nanoarchaeota archaeon]
MRISCLLLIIILFAGCQTQECTTDSDCIIKETDCNCCGHIYGCAPENSEDFTCAEEGFPCTCINPKPESCVCKNNLCTVPDDE